MASFFDLSQSSFSYYSVPGAFFLIMLPHTYATVLAGRNHDISSNRHAAQAKAEKDDKMDKVHLLRLRRAYAASANGLETVGLYAGGIAAAHAAGVSPGTVNALALAYLALRVAYNYVYVILQDDRRWAPVRSALWLTSASLVAGIWVTAGRVAAASGAGAA